MRLLVTRPKEDAQRTAAALAARGHEVKLAPLLSIEPIADANVGPPTWQAVLLTSANAARAIVSHREFEGLKPLPVLAVGRHTAESARTAGFRDVISADGGAADLANLAAQRFGRGARLLYLAGADRARDIAPELAAAGMAVQIAAVYRARAAESLPDEIEGAFRNRQIDGVLHFSRRSAEIFLDCAERAGIVAAALAPTHFCISAPVAEPLAHAGAASIRIAAQPDEDAIVALTGSSA
jgi:uroporphyrinogen-III synthase